jgi:hypothetical protein
MEMVGLDRNVKVIEMDRDVPWWELRIVSGFGGNVYWTIGHQVFVQVQCGAHEPPPFS